MGLVGYISSFFFNFLSQVKQRSCERIRVHPLVYFITDIDNYVTSNQLRARQQQIIDTVTWMSYRGCTLYSVGTRLMLCLIVLYYLCLRNQKLSFMYLCRSPYPISVCTAPTKRPPPLIRRIKFECHFYLVPNYIAT